GPALNVIPVPPITLAAVAPLPMSIAPSVLTVVTGPVPPNPLLASVSPNVTPPEAVVTVIVPSDEVAVAAPMLALKNTLPVPAFSTRSLCSAPWLLIVALFVNVMSPAPTEPVSIVRSLLRVTAPFRRTSSSVVVAVSLLMANGPPLNVIPVPPITLAAVAPLPMSIAPSVLTVVTGPVPPNPLLASVSPNVTPPEAVVTVIVPSDEVAVAAPMLALKNTLPVPAFSTRTLCSAP